VELLEPIVAIQEGADRHGRVQLFWYFSGFVLDYYDWPRGSKIFPRIAADFLRNSFALSNNTAGVSLTHSTIGFKKDGDSICRPDRVFSRNLSARDSGAG
jgi:hypothetical protein